MDNEKEYVNGCYTALLLESIRDFCAHLHDHSGQYLMGLMLVENGSKKVGLEHRKESWSEKDLAVMQNENPTDAQARGDSLSSNASSAFGSPPSPRRK